MCPGPGRSLNRPARMLTRAATLQATRAATPTTKTTPTNFYSPSDVTSIMLRCSKGNRAGTLRVVADGALP